MRNRFSFLIKPLFIILDLLVLNGILYIIEDSHYISFSFLLYVNIIWLFASYFNDYYQIKRNTNELKLINLLLKQLIVFTLSFFAYFTLFNEGVVVNNQFIVLSNLTIFLSLLKFITYYLLKIYRKFGKNYRRVVVIGDDYPSKRITEFFKSTKNYGYRFFGFFSDEPSDSIEYLGGVNNVTDYVIKNNIDEIYTSFGVMSMEKQKEIIWFSKSHNIQIRLLPKAKDLFSKNLTLEYYETTPVFHVKELPFELSEVRFLKRSFDILFSLLAIIFLLSWLYPILWIIIKIESKGPVLFKQEREGLNGKNFPCYKFRSMRMNDESDVKSAQKNDSRITRIGKFIRRTSIDELPQFFNVFKGDMSVVGPRPHMTKQSQGFENLIDNYYKRNAVKPGITGLAQVSGYRGEIIKKSDIENRIRLDIFYIEKWSFLLDVKIIIKTITNVFVGDEKAY